MTLQTSRVCFSEEFSSAILRRFRDAELSASRRRAFIAFSRAITHARPNSLLEQEKSVKSPKIIPFHLKPVVDRLIFTKPLGRVIK